MLNDENIVTSAQAESDPVDDETGEGEDNNNESSKGPSNSGTFPALETVMEWYEQQSECYSTQLLLLKRIRAAVAEWYRYRTVACFVTGSNPVPLKTRRVGQRCTLNLSRAETSSCWCGVVVRRGGASSGCRPRHLTMVQNYVVRGQKPSCS
ncbi:uncharacterized protein TNCV_742131 [Trichonephila clavipes]|nr:uncharacterized protein TNCV_742131 [Trichonephila clavipes]